MNSGSRWTEITMSEKRFRQLCKLAGVPYNAEHWKDADSEAFDDKTRKLLYYALDQHSPRKS